MNVHNRKWRIATLARPCAVALAGLLLTACAEGPSASTGAGETLAVGESAAERVAADLKSKESPARLARHEAPGDSGYVRASALGDYLAGRFANNRRDLSAAADYMMRVLRTDPANVALQNEAFLLLASVGRLDEALALAEPLAARDGSAGPAAILLALDHARAGDLDRASEVVSALPDRGLTSLMKPLLAGWLKTGQGDVDAGVDAVRALRDGDGFGPLRDVHAALMYDVAGRVDEAEEAYRESSGDMGRLSMRLAWMAGNFYERQGRSDEAIAIYQRFLAETPDHLALREIHARVDRSGEAVPDPVVASAVEGMAEAMFNVAGMLSQQRAEDVALIYTHLALHLRPDFEVAEVLLGEILQTQDRHREAIEVYRRVGEDSPFRHVARMRVAESLQELGRYDEAAELLERVAADVPDFYEPLQQLGSLLRVQERFEEAAEAYARAVARVETAESRHWPLLYFQGVALERTDRWDEAEAAFLAALELEPEQPHVMNYLAYSWVEQKENLEEAERMLVRAVELRPDDGYIVDSLGWVYYRLGRYDEAVTHLERAVELRPHDPIINDHLGDAYWKVGREAEARFQWKRALRYDPEPEDVPIIETKLEQGLEAARQIDG